MSRKLEEWIGKTDDSAVPPRVRLRIFDAYGGKDYTTGQKIRAGDKWDLDHIIALCNGGENRESNLAPILKSNHIEKTKDDVAEKAKVERIRKKNLGIYPKPKGNARMQSKPFANTRG